MARLDPLLEYYFDRTVSELAVLHFAPGTPVHFIEAEPMARVLIEFREEPSYGRFPITSVASKVAAGYIPTNLLSKLQYDESIVAVEATRPLYPELDVSVPEILAHKIHSAASAHYGANVIVGIVDTGIDFTHPCFLDPSGKTRLLAIWDQGLTCVTGESAPASHPFGVEYSKADIDAALALANPFSKVRHKDLSGHGTHVAGIAAGNGAAPGNGKPAHTYVGVAPKADILVVANRKETDMGNSANALDAVDFLIQKAKTFNKPIVINISSGSNIGPHDGTSLLERGIDNLISGVSDVAVVKSAGNERDQATHAAGTVVKGRPTNISLEIPPKINSAKAVTIDIWYESGDRFDVALESPTGFRTSPKSPGVVAREFLSNNNEIFFSSSLANPFNGNNRIYLQLTRGTASEVEPGKWEIYLTAAIIHDGGHFDAWLENPPKDRAKFVGSTVNSFRSITIPGTGKEIITVGAYVTKSSGPTGNLAAFSSIGPTRDGRTKPNLAAPGELICSANNGHGSTSSPYADDKGTSLAAPHVTGTIALLLEKKPGLTPSKIRDLLEVNARSDAHTKATPNQEWGQGKLDAEASFIAA